MPQDDRRYRRARGRRGRRRTTGCAAGAFDRGRAQLRSECPGAVEFRTATGRCAEAARPRPAAAPRCGIAAVTGTPEIWVPRNETMVSLYTPTPTPRTPRDADTNAGARIAARDRRVPGVAGEQPVEHRHLAVPGARELGELHRRDQRGRAHQAAPGLGRRRRSTASRSSSCRRSSRSWRSTSRRTAMRATPGRTRAAQRADRGRDVVGRRPSRAGGAAGECKLYEMFRAFPGRAPGRPIRGAVAA